MAKNDMMTWEEAVSWLKSQPDKAGLVEACFYDDPILQSAERFYSTTEWHETQRILSGRSGRALDIGAGRGISSFALAKDGWQVTALEPDPSPEVGAGAVFRLAREANLPIEVVTDWGEKLPFEDASFDSCVGRHVALLIVAGEHSSHDFSAANGGAAPVIRDIVNTIADELLGAPRPQFSGAARPGDPQHYQADITKAQEWDWQPQHAWQDGVRSYARWFQDGTR